MDKSHSLKELLTLVEDELTERKAIVCLEHNTYDMFEHDTWYMTTRNMQSWKHYNDVTNDRNSYMRRHRIETIIRYYSTYLDKIWEAREKEYQIKYGWIQWKNALLCVRELEDNEGYCTSK